MNCCSLKVPGRLCKFILPEARKILTKENKYFSLGIWVFIFKNAQEGAEKVKCYKSRGKERKETLVIKVDLNLIDNLKQEHNILIKGEDI